MRILLFGATGMIGQGALLACLADEAVSEVTVIVRRSTGRRHEKLREHILPDPGDLSALVGQLSNYDACLFCLGISAAGLSEAAYRHTTYDLTLSIAQTLVQESPGLTFVYVSGGGTDETGRSRMMWARVKGETENALLALPFARVFLVRPSYIHPDEGVRFDQSPYRWVYRLTGCLGPSLPKWLPRYATSTARLGEAMIEVARHGFPRPRLENADLNDVAASVRARATSAQPSPSRAA
jgi:uncharacterized protein YbjT (DUF2867 family)